MPKIISAFSTPNPLGKMLGDLGSQLWGDQTAKALNGEKLYAEQRANAETDNLMRQVAGSGAQSLGSNPVTQAILIGSGYKPDDFAKIGLMGAATGYGARDQRTQNWQVGSGQSYDNTAGAFDSKLAETRRANNMASADRRYSTDRSVGESARQFDMTPVEALVNGLPAFVQRSGAFGDGVSPILSDAERKGTLAGQFFGGGMGALTPEQKTYLGADPSSSSGTPRNYVMPDGKSFITYDGVTDAQSGQALPGGGYIGTVQGGAGDVGLTNSVKTDMQSDIASANNFTNLADRMIQLTDSPENFGLIGKLRSVGQEGMQAFNALSGIVGGDIGQAARTAREELNSVTNGAGAKLLPEIYDPNLPKAELLGGLILYSGAAALAGQQGRSVSDQDVKFMRRILGDPFGTFESAQSIKTKVTLAKDIVQEHKRLAEQYLAKGLQPPESLAEEAAANVLGGSGGNPAAPAPAPAPAQNVGVPQPGTVEDGYRFKGGDPSDPNSWEPVQ